MAFRAIAYIDGFNLYYGMREKGWRHYYWLDVVRLVELLLRKDQQLQMVKYFTAIVSSTPADPNKNKRQTTYIEALKTKRYFQIFYGHFLPKPVSCRKCGATWSTHEEKMTDVNIATQMLHDAYQDLYDTALLISGDSDLKAPIETIRRQFPNKWIIVAFPPGRESLQLRRLANHSFMITRRNLSISQLPDAITKTDGYTLHRPEIWREKDSAK